MDVNVAEQDVDRLDAYGNSEWVSYHKVGEGVGRNAGRYYRVLVDLSWEWHEPFENRDAFLQFLCSVDLSSNFNRYLRQAITDLLDSEDARQAGEPVLFHEVFQERSRPLPD
jgi:hypothetical protein